MIWNAKNEDDLTSIAKELIKACGSRRIVAFNGEMGAGKTTLIKRICNELGVQASTSSPTFSIVNEYHSSNGQRIFHFDFYRINSPAEAVDIGISEYLESGDWCLIEWPEKIYNLLTSSCVQVGVQIEPDRSRTITLTQ